MTLVEVQADLVFAKAAYTASLKGEELRWEGRSIKMLSPPQYMDEIRRLERMEYTLLNSNRKGHNTSLADFS